MNAAFDIRSNHSNIQTSLPINTSISQMSQAQSNESSELQIGGTQPVISINSDSHNPNEETVSATTNDETQLRLRQIFD